MQQRLEKDIIPKLISGPQVNGKYFQQHITVKWRNLISDYKYVFYAALPLPFTITFLWHFSEICTWSRKTYWALNFELNAFLLLMSKVGIELATSVLCLDVDNAIFNVKQISITKRAINLNTLTTSFSYFISDRRV